MSLGDPHTASVRSKQNNSRPDYSRPTILQTYWRFLLLLNSGQPTAIWRYFSAHFYSYNFYLHSHNPPNNIFVFPSLNSTFQQSRYKSSIQPNLLTFLRFSCTIPATLSHPLLLFRGLFRQDTTWNLCLRRTANPLFSTDPYFSPDSSLSPHFTAFPPF